MLSLYLLMSGFLASECLVGAIDVGRAAAAKSSHTNGGGLLRRQQKPKTRRAEKRPQREEDEKADEEEDEEADDEDDEGNCWSGCSNGKCQWGFSGCKCQCEENWAGPCCTRMVECSAATDQCCPQDQLVQRHADCDALEKHIGDTIQVGTADHGLPENMQGIFWLTDQADSSSLMSFAQTNDGCGMADASTLGKKDPFKVRTAGDRTWAFSDLGESWHLVRRVDLTYNFYVDGTTMTIIPHAVKWGIKVPRWLLKFDAHELDLEEKDESSRSYVKPEDKARKYLKGGSKIWRRVSFYWWFGEKEATSSEYDLVQVVDGAGKPIQPAFNDWVKYCNHADAGQTPGMYFYHEAMGSEAAYEAQEKKKE